MVESAYYPELIALAEQKYGKDRETIASREFSVADSFPLLSADRNPVATQSIGVGTVSVVKHLTGHRGIMSAKDFYDLVPLCREAIYRQHSFLREFCPNDLNGLLLRPLTRSEIVKINDGLGCDKLSRDKLANLTNPVPDSETLRIAVPLPSVEGQLNHTPIGS